jgi:hypothetical protein
MVTTATKIEFRLTPVEGGGRLTTYQIAIAIDGEIVWPVRSEPDVTLEFQIDDLLAYLTEFWTPLMLRQVYPIGVNPGLPSDLRRAAEGRWAELPRETVEREERLVFSFEEAHNLNTAFSGYFGLPSFWLMRVGGEYLVEAGGFVWHLPFDSVRAALESAGNLICERLSAANMEWAEAIAAWHDRNNSDGVALLAWATGINTELAQKFISDGTLLAPKDFDDAANDNDEIRMAARMAGELPPDQIRSILLIARQFKKVASDPLQSLAKECLSHLSKRNTRSKPFVQGEAVASFVRERLRLSSDRSVEVFQICSDLGVIVRTQAAEPQSLLGLAIWGRQFGPGVFINEASTAQLAEHGPINPKERPVSRVTLAHELCHLLLDGEHTLSAVEVLQARMPKDIERRAKSFAGEFLLPKHVAAEAWIKAKRPTGQTQVEQVVDDLARTFGVTRKVAAWKLEHGANLYFVNLSAVLNSIEPYR